MRLALFAAAMAVSVSAGATAGALDLRPPHVDMLELTGAVPNSPVCETAEFKIYFEQGQARLTEAAERTLDVVGHQVKGCAINAIRLEAPTSDVSTREGQKIAGERGAMILKALAARGVNAEQVVVVASGLPNEPASASPQHLTVGIAASRAPLSAQTTPAPRVGDDA